MADSNSKGDFLVGLLVGGALGAALALLYAPQSGGETRDTLKRKVGDLQDTLQDTASGTYDKVKSQTTSLAAQVKDSTTSLAAQAREAVGKVKEDVSAGASSVEASAVPLTDPAI